jgi:hypothetical protein
VIPTSRLCCPTIGYVLDLKVVTIAPKRSSKHRPGYCVTMLICGFLVGGLGDGRGRSRMVAFGSVKELLTTAVTRSLGQIDIDLVIIKFGLGPSRLTCRCRVSPGF